MIRKMLKQSPEVLISLLSAGLWFFGFGNIYYFIYQILSSPDEPTRTLWIFLIVQSFFMGFLPAAIASFLFCENAKKSFSCYLSVLMLFILCASFIGGDISAVKQLALSYGAWAFIMGSIIGLLIGNHVNKVHNKSLKTAR